MTPQLLHVFRNTPFGRETFMQALFFAKNMGLSIQVYVPKYKSFLFYFENSVVQVDLDDSYVAYPSTAREHASALMREHGVTGGFLEPKEFTASTLPDLPVQFEFMVCPRSMTDKVTKIGMGYIGPRVRKLVQAAPFPVLIPSICFKPWKSITVFVGGSHNSMRALRLGVHIHNRTGAPLDIFTQQEPGRDKKTLEEAMAQHRLTDEVAENVREWRIFEQGDFVQNLYNVPHDALAVMGAYGHGLLRDILFGNIMETININLPNCLLVVGPQCTF